MENSEWKKKSSMMNKKNDINNITRDFIISSTRFYCNSKTESNQFNNFLNSRKVDDIRPEMKKKISVLYNEMINPILPSQEEPIKNEIYLPNTISKEKGLVKESFRRSRIPISSNSSFRINTKGEKLQRVKSDIYLMLGEIGRDKKLKHNVSHNTSGNLNLVSERFKQNAKMFNKILDRKDFSNSMAYSKSLSRNSTNISVLSSALSSRKESKEQYRNKGWIRGAILNSETSKSYEKDDDFFFPKKEKKIQKVKQIFPLSLQMQMNFSKC